MSGGVVCCPFGPTSAIPIVLTIILFGLSMIGSFGCSFWQYSQQVNVRFAITDQLGLWSYLQRQSCWPNCQVTYFCAAYPSGTTFDYAWVAGRAFSMMAAILAIILLVMLCTFACLPWPPKTWTIMAILSVLTGVFQLVSLAGLATDICLSGSLSGICSIGSAGICAIVAGVLWFVNAVILCKFPNKEAREEIDDLPMGAPAAAPQTTVEKTVETINKADGTTVTKTTTTTTSPDGSKTITETVDE